MSQTLSFIIAHSLQGKCYYIILLVCLSLRLRFGNENGSESHYSKICIILGAYCIFMVFLNASLYALNEDWNFKTRDMGVPWDLVVKDLALSVLWYGFSSWSGNFCMPWVRQKKKKDMISEIFHHYFAPCHTEGIFFFTIHKKDQCVMRILFFIFPSLTTYNLLIILFVSIKVIPPFSNHMQMSLVWH